MSDARLKPPAALHADFTDMSELFVCMDAFDCLTSVINYILDYIYIVTANRFLHS